MGNGEDVTQDGLKHRTKLVEAGFAGGRCTRAPDGDPPKGGAEAGVGEDVGIEQKHRGARREHIVTEDSSGSSEKSSPKARLELLLDVKVVVSAIREQDAEVLIEARKA
jgi:hypothetical protein